jgi:undecaprenyl-diphosphatase
VIPPWLAVVLLGVLEGVTEFLPISSTGHLLLVENLGWLPRQSDVFNIVIQGGAALAVLAAFGGRLRALADLRNPASRTYLGQLAVAFAITGVGGLVAKALGFQLPKTIAPIAWATLIGGVVIIVVERWLRDRPGGREVTWPVAVAVALGQLVAAIFPGASRSGTTIIAALLLGLGRPAATEFSFLLGVPTLLAAGALELRHAVRGPGGTDWALLALGTVVAALSAGIVVRWLLRFVQTHTFTVFGWYRVALGVVMLALAARSAP